MPISGRFSRARTTWWSDRDDDASGRTSGPASGRGARAGPGVRTRLVTVAVEDLLRELAPQALGALVRRYGHFDAWEDAVQEGLLAATAQWPDQGLPQNARGWLITVASRRLTDQLRSDQARQPRESAIAALGSRDRLEVPDRDYTLTLLFLCCHPALSPASQLALTLRAVG